VGDAVVQRMQAIAVQGKLTDGVLCGQCGNRKRAVRELHSVRKTVAAKTGSALSELLSPITGLAHRFAQIVDRNHWERPERQCAARTHDTVDRAPSGVVLTIDDRALTSEIFPVKIRRRAGAVGYDFDNVSEAGSGVRGEPRRVGTLEKYCA